jgi:hypothetical protein
MPIDYTPRKKKETFLGFSNKYSKSIKIGGIVSPIRDGYNPRETTRYPSRVTSGGTTSIKQSTKYTGSEMIGVTILHKSCLQPVFTSEAAKDAASMRR